MDPEVVQPVHKEISVKKSRKSVVIYGVFLIRNCNYINRFCIALDIFTHCIKSYITRTLLIYRSKTGDWQSKAS